MRAVSTARMSYKLLIVTLITIITLSANSANGQICSPSNRGPAGMFFNVTTRNFHVFTSDGDHLTATINPRTSRIRTNHNNLSVA